MDEVPEELSFRTSLSLINDDTPVKHKLQVDECHIINLRSNAKAFYQTGEILDCFNKHNETSYMIII
jgi:hypothetical protein